MHVVITGAAGFIGGHLSERLLAAGHRVTGVDNFDPYYPPRIKRRTVAHLALSPRFTLVEGDVRDASTLAQAMADGPECVVHLAALAGVRSSIERPAEYIDVNVRGSTLVLDAARRAGVRRLVMASSSSVYGDGAASPFQEGAPLGDPLSPYAASKRGMEHIATAYHRLYALNIALLRFFTVYGPRQRPDLAIHKFARRVLEGDPIPVFGDGRSRRDYTHIDDIVSGVVGAIAWTAAPEARLDTFNLASGRTVTLSEMIAAVEEATGKRALIERLPDQPGDMSETWGDVSKARASLGLPAAVDFRRGVADFVRWMREEEGL